MLRPTAGPRLGLENHLPAPQEATPERLRRGWTHGISGRRRRIAGMAELVDATDLKSVGGCPPCGFESRSRY